MNILMEQGNSYWKNESCVTV